MLIKNVDKKQKLIYPTRNQAKANVQRGEKMKLNTWKIKLILAEKEMTWTALAESIGMANQNLSTIVGRGTCSPITAGKLAKGLGVTISDIVQEG